MEERAVPAGDLGASSAIGWIVPITLLAAMTETSRVLGRNAAASAAGSIDPVRAARADK